MTTLQTEWGANADNFQDMTQRNATMDVSEKEESAQKEAVEFLQIRSPAKFNQKLMRKRKKGY